MLTEETLQDKIEVVGDYKAVQVRTATVIKKDGVEISRGFHRHVLQPSTKTDGSWADTDISGESAEVQGICNAVWSDSVKTAFQAAMDAQSV
jgi:AMMECR1 domain-containing protein|tara:strand:- start:64 stop:339 length:276 start_codon:yes stop_codon:yes gene_type:complete